MQGICWVGRTASFLLIEEMVASMLLRQIHRPWLKACCLHDEDGFATALLRFFVSRVILGPIVPFHKHNWRTSLLYPESTPVFSSQTYFIGWVSCFGKNRLKSLSNSTFAGSIITLSNRAAAMVEVVKTNSVTAIKIRRD